ncbi:nuclease [uncultured Mediterranean phage uvMED]|nr:nuclease [uncultured Mediterranean phage uvMED]
MGFGGKIKRNIADKHLSDSVRKSAEWKCQRCRKDYKDKPQGLQCSHFISRGHWGSRYSPKQLSLCAYCHNHVEGHPVDHINLWKSIHGGDNPDEAIQKMVEIAACKGRAQYARNNIKAISAHYRAESKRLDGELELKAKGKEADLEVYSYIRKPNPSDT